MSSSSCCSRPFLCHDERRSMVLNDLRSGRHASARFWSSLPCTSIFSRTNSPVPIKLSSAGAAPPGSLVNRQDTDLHPRISSHGYCLVVLLYMQNRLVMIAFLKYLLNTLSHILPAQGPVTPTRIIGRVETDTDRRR